LGYTAVSISVDKLNFIGHSVGVKKVAAILLAAGRSRRMGAFKPLLPFGDKTVITSCIDNLRSGGADYIIVVVGHEAQKIEAHLREKDLRFAVNDDPDSEMGVSIVCGIRSVPENVGAVLIALVDHPAVDASIIQTIIEAWRSGHRLVIPEFNGRGGHPVLVDARYRNELLALDPSLGLRSLFQTHKSDVCRRQVGSSFVARDMDTWDDYLTLHQEVFGELPSNTLGKFDREPEIDPSEPN
jgi:CTP:molybdopterin cytidylyltransferase MocA